MLDTEAVASESVPALTVDGRTAGSNPATSFVEQTKAHTTCTDRRGLTGSLRSCRVCVKWKGDVEGLCCDKLQSIA